MKAIETVLHVTANGTAILQIPPDLSPGDHQVVLVIHEQAIANAAESFSTNQHPTFPVIHAGSWAEVGSLRREDFYDDDAR